MSDRMHYQLELSNETATLYVAGGLGAESVTALLDVCRTLPAGIRTLRLDLRGVGAMTADATNAVRLLLRDWREERHGEFRLSTSFLLATCSEVTTPAVAARLAWNSEARLDALTSTYL